MISENEKLKKLLGEKELEIEILRDLLKKTNPHLPIKRNCKKVDIQRI
ncbi:hypothetical protein PTH_0719 [Pelotomaculum thermopropionicum SI]|uniref:Uncharacterized protein n=1 Tax=Pelotomaculum thermopropionicum (strain DSM 13744 / JCM 10971 / SI) TaxID=370438 RepID=A5D4D5_PELTS|nr:hypothetical protein PTH_0719 [Pelotomaculum thermopropionicum SI]